MPAASPTSLLISVTAFPDNDDFLPINDGSGGFELKVGPQTEELAIPPRMSFVIDGGLILDFPNDKIVEAFVQVDKSWAKKGLILTAITKGRGKQRLQFVAYNVGKQILAFDVGETIGRFSLLTCSTKVALMPKSK